MSLERFLLNDPTTQNNISFQSDKTSNKNSPGPSLDIHGHGYRICT